MGWEIWLVNVVDVFVYSVLSVFSSPSLGLVCLGG